jgi:hypothetical protein
MPFDLLNPTIDSSIVRAALTMEIFTLPQLARFAHVKIRTLRSMFNRHLDHFEAHPAQLGNRRGRQSKVYQLTAAARTAYQDLADPLQMPPNADFGAMLEAATMALAAADYALRRAKQTFAPIEERDAQREAAWSHCQAGDHSLRLASNLAVSARQRTLVTEQRRAALRVFKELTRSLPS